MFHVKHFTPKYCVKNVKHYIKTERETFLKTKDEH